MNINLEELVHHADLHFDSPAERCEEGLPIGNGRMGTLIWTSPNAIKMQINRSDVFASGPDTESFPDEHRDYGYGCALFDLDFVGFGPDVFDSQTEEDLDVWNAVASIRANGISVDTIAIDDDVFAMKVSDQRNVPTECAAKLRLLRAAEVYTRPKHTARSYLEHAGRDTIVLRQVFKEKEYYCSSVVACKVVGRPTIARINDENNGDHRILPEGMCGFGASTEYEMRLCMPALAGDYYVYLSSATTMNKDEEKAIREEAIGKVNRAAEAGYEALLGEHIKEWNKFWDKSYIKLSGFEEAELLETHYQYYMYLMNCMSKNSRFAPNFGGLIFSPRGDLRHWGAMQWWNNLTLTYNAVLPSGHTELIEPYLNMYFNAKESLEKAAWQHFGAKGIYIFETMHVLGPEPIPDELEDEFRNFMLDRGPANFNDCSEALRKFGYSRPTLESRWDFLNPAVRKEGRPYAWCTHFFSSAAFLAYHYYLRYAYTDDLEFLREKGYPMIRGVAEFFRTYPNTTSEVYPKYPDVADGKIHIYGTSDGEANWGAYDSCGSLTAMHGILKVAIICAEILGIDADLVKTWKETLDNLTPIPTNKRKDLPDCMKGSADDPEFYIMVPGNNWPNPAMGTATYPLIHMDMCTLDTKDADPERWRIGRNTYDRIKNPGDVGNVGEMSTAPQMWAQMGDSRNVVGAISGQLRCVGAKDEHCWYVENGSKAPYRNRLTAREGVNAISAQRLGNAAAGLQKGLLQCSGGAPAAPGIIRVFPAWNKNNNAQFCLYARDGFRVTAACEGGAITGIEILSTLGGTCRLHHPWFEEAPEREIIIRSEKGEMRFSGETILFPTEAGVNYTVELA